MTKRGRPKKADATARAEEALARWLKDDPARPRTAEDLARVREALGRTEYAVDETGGKR